MNEEEAEEFFDSLEGKGELKEPFKIPKKPKEEEKIPEKPKEEDKIPETEDGEIQEEEEDEETIRPMKRIRSIKEDKGDCEKKGGSPASKKIKNSPPFNNPNDPLGNNRNINCNLNWHAAPIMSCKAPPLF